MNATIEPGRGAMAGHGPFAQPGVGPPLNRLFDQLRDIWRAQHPDKRYSDLAEILGVRRPDIAQWASGSDKRKPPWNVVMWLCSETGYEVRGDGNGWRLLRRDGTGGYQLDPDAEGIEAVAGATPLVPEEG